MLFSRAIKTKDDVKLLNLSAKAKKYSDTIGGKDKADFLSFSLQNSSSFSLNSYTPKKAVQLQLLNAVGKKVKLPAWSMNGPEKIKTILETGTYYIRVRPGVNREATRYSLTLAAIPLKADMAVDQNNTQNMTQISVDSVVSNTAPNRAVSNSTIDIMIVYTAEARQAAGGTDAINRDIQAEVEEVNQGYSNSGIFMRLRLVHTAETNYAESGVASVDLARLQSKNDGNMDGVHAMRDTYGADVVSLYVNKSNTAGIGYVMSTLTPAFEASAFSVVQIDAAKKQLTLAHEVGHNLGVEHDPLHATGPSAYPYGYGYISSDGYGDVMSYSPSRINYYANPNIIINGKPFGTSGQNVVEAFNNVRFLAADWRPTRV